MKTKEEIRKKLLKLRRNISQDRREKARRSLAQKLYPLLQPFRLILSFASKEEEIDLWLLNHVLVKEDRLLFPRLVSKMELLPFAVKDFTYQLETNPKWKVLEPLPDRCSLVAFDHISCVLVPGLGFDANKQRLGYGKGHYDRFLAKLKCPFYGIGFKEQYLTEPIPAQPHDIPLTEIYLF